MREWGHCVILCEPMVGASRAGKANAHQVKFTY